MSARFSPAQAIIAAIALAVVGFVVWANWAELDQVTRAPGRLVPFERVQIVQSEEGGAIARIAVREGEKVRKGQLLVEMDTVKLEAAVREAEAKVAALESRMARIEAELHGTPLRFPPSLSAYPELVRNQRQLFARRKAALNAEIGALEQLARYQQRELDLNLPLVETGDVAMSEIIRMRAQLAETRGRISNLKAQYVRDLQAEFAATEEELGALREQLTRARDSLKGARLLAPRDGIVKNLKFTTIGAVVRPGEEVLQIVPTGAKLIVETRVAPRDIAFVRVGQRARVNFDSYDSAIYGSAAGKVVYVSPDTLTAKTPDGREESFYRVDLEVDVSTMKQPKGRVAVELQPGMTGTAEILTGKNTVWRYLTKPLLKTVDDAMEER